MSSRLEVYTTVVSDKTTWIFLRLIGTEGREGVGEATLNPRAGEIIEALPAALAAIAACPQGHGAKLTAVRAQVAGVVGRAIASGLEQAWLDREGHRHGQPLHALLGGRYRSVVPTYANINRGTLSRRPDEFASRAELAITAGFEAVKLAPFDGVTPDAGDERARNDLIEAGMARVAAVVERVRGRARVQVDCHSRFRPAEAPSILTRLARIGISWFEEPILETADARPVLAALRRQAQSLGVILAGAEKAADLAEFLPFGLDGCYDVLMPDIVLAGGPGEVMRIGHFAAAHGVGLSLHNPCGPVMDMHSAHVAACVPRLQSLERQFRESPLYDAIVTRAHDDTGGTITLGDAPGLGLTVDWDHPQVTPVAGFDIAL